MGFLQERAASFGYAIKGIATLISTQKNAQIHLAATVLVVAVGVMTDLTGTAWCLLSFAIAGVWVAEPLNTAIEFLADAAVPERHPLVGKAKDVAAGGVLRAVLPSSQLRSTKFHHGEEGTSGLLH